MGDHKKDNGLWYERGLVFSGFCTQDRLKNHDDLDYYRVQVLGRGFMVTDNYDIKDCPRCGWPLFWSNKYRITKKKAPPPATLPGYTGCGNRAPRSKGPTPKAIRKGTAKAALRNEPWFKRLLERA